MLAFPHGVGMGWENKYVAGCFSVLVSDAKKTWSDRAVDQTTARAEVSNPFLEDGKQQAWNIPRALHGSDVHTVVKFDSALVQRGTGNCQITINHAN